MNRVLKIGAFMLLVPVLGALGQTESPDPRFLGRWELFAEWSYLEGYFEFPAGNREQIHVSSTKIHVLDSDQTVVHVIPGSWDGNSFYPELGPEVPYLYPFVTGCEPVGGIFEAEEKYFPSWEPPCALPPCLMLGPQSQLCTDGGVYIYIEPQGVPVESSSISAVKALY
jgi:hypothetical protein